MLAYKNDLPLFCWLTLLYMLSKYITLWNFGRMNLMKWRIISHYKNHWLWSRPCFIFCGPLGTVPTILTLATWRLSLNCGGGARTAASGPWSWPLTNSGGGGRQNSSFSSFSDSRGGGSCASETACRDIRLAEVLFRLGRWDFGDRFEASSAGLVPGTSWSELTPDELLSPSSRAISTSFCFLRKSFG